MKIYAISDLHLSNSCDKPMDIFGEKWKGHTDKILKNWNEKVTNDDLVLVAGDISWAMKLEDAKPDLDWIEKLAGKKIIIKGNHEYWWKSISAVREILPSSIMAIQNDAIKFDGFIVCGTRGWVVPEENEEFSAEDEKIYKREVERLKLTLKSAKALQTDNEKIICMMHFPPFDGNGNETEFTKVFEEYDVNTVVFGHIHGYTNCKLKQVKNDITYLLTSCDHINCNPIEINI